jgi:hypothetical protein
MPHVIPALDRDTAIRDWFESTGVLRTSTPRRLDLVSAHGGPVSWLRT